jgi:hypothetical protein
MNPLTIRQKLQAYSLKLKYTFIFKLGMGWHFYNKFEEKPWRHGLDWSLWFLMSYPARGNVL